MRNVNFYLLALACVTAIGSLTPAVAYGQLAQAIDDYKHDRPFQYAPSDPWTRSRLYNQHIKHAGWFYNCDGEQCKRNSPYIFWKTQHQPDLPTGTSWWQRLNRTTAEIKQRIADGSCADGDCVVCEKCRSTGGSLSTATPSASCPRCASNPANHAPPTNHLISDAIGDGGPAAIASTDPRQTNDLPQPKNNPLQATRTHPAVVHRKVAANRTSNRPAGLESLDTRIKNR